MSEWRLEDGGYLWMILDEDDNIIAEGMEREIAEEIVADHNARAQQPAIEVEQLREALAPLLDEFGARLSDGKPLGYTVAAMNHCLKLIDAASAALASGQREPTPRP